MTTEHGQVQRSTNGQFIRSPHGQFDDRVAIDDFPPDADLLMIVFTDESVYGDPAPADDSAWAPEGWAWNPGSGYVGAGDADPQPGFDHYEHFKFRWGQIVPGHHCAVLLVQVRGFPGLSSLEPGGAGIPEFVTHTSHLRPILQLDDSLRLALRRAVDLWDTGHGSAINLRRLQWLTDGTRSMRENGGAFGERAILPSQEFRAEVIHYLHNELGPLADDFDDRHTFIGENWLTEATYAAWDFYADLSP